MVYGKVINNDSTGDVFISCKSGKTTASIELAGEDYEIYATDNAMHLMVQFDTAKLNKDTKCGTDNATAQSSFAKGNSPVTDLQQTCIDYARMLVMYTPAAQQAVADINQTINLSIIHFNAAITRSAIGNAAQVQLVGSQPFNFQEGPYVSVDAKNLANDPNAQAARSNAKADLVILLTNGNYGTAYGAAAVIGPNSSQAYAIVQVLDATSNRETFTHEAGHIYGCHHDYASDASGTAYAHGYSFSSNGKSYYTVMVDGSYISSSNYRLLNFSNPSVTVQGKPSGTPTHENNAREVYETYTTVAGFLPAVPTLQASVSGATGGCCYKKNVMQVLYSCGAAPYTFDWRASNDGINYGTTPIGTTESITTYTPCNPGNYWYVKVTVKSADGQTATGFASIYIDHSCTGGKSAGIAALDKPLVPADDRSFTLQVQPNPVSQTGRISFTTPGVLHVQIDMFSSRGALVQTIFSGQLPGGNHQYSFDAKKMSAGTYLCRVTAGNRVQTKYILIR